MRRLASWNCNFHKSTQVHPLVGWSDYWLDGYFFIFLYDPILSVVNLKLFVQKTFKMTMIIIVRCYLSRYLAI